jgi:S-adenosylmethionine:tRNA ribosyltransferase-isomerase
MQESFAVLSEYLHTAGLSALIASTRIIIAPGYTYRVVKGMVTNFHQPKSTLLLLVSALMGDSWRDMYDYALANGYRFLSYGDACLLKA